MAGAPRDPVWRSRSWFARLLAVYVLTIGWALAAESLRDRLTPDEFHRAGLDKLTSEELRFLEDCLAKPGIVPPSAQTAAKAAPLPASATEQASIQGAAAFGREEQIEIEKSRQVPTAIQSRIPGVFEGWGGRTVFHLQNGQIWRQIDNGRFSVHLTNPVVVIEKGMLGAYYLHLDDYGSRVKVERVK
jgi:hypothetical protein